MAVRKVAVVAISTFDVLVWSTCRHLSPLLVFVSIIMHLTEAIHEHYQTDVGKVVSASPAQRVLHNLEFAALYLLVYLLGSFFPHKTGVVPEAWLIAPVTLLLSMWAF